MAGKVQDWLPNLQGLILQGKMKVLKNSALCSKIIEKFSKTSKIPPKKW